MEAVDCRQTLREKRLENIEPLLRIVCLEEAFSRRRGSSTPEIAERGVPLGQLIRRDAQQNCGGTRKELRANRV